MGDEQRIAVARADAEDVGRVLATLRAEYSSEPLSGLLSLVDWRRLRRYGETHAGYQERLYGPLEPLA